MLKIKSNLHLLAVIFTALLLSLLFFSCDNSITLSDDTYYYEEPAPQEETPGYTNQILYATVHGHYNSQGAMPSEILNAQYVPYADYLITSRSAIPTIGSTQNQIRYYAKAIPTQEGEQTVSGTVNTTEKTFDIPGLKLNVEWKVEVGIEVQITDSEGNEDWVRCFYDVSEPYTITVTDLAISNDFILRPDSTGTGYVELNITVDSSINQVQVQLEDDTQLAAWNAAVAADANKEISTSKIKVADLPSGVYDLTLLFYKSGAAYPVFSSVQTINVIRGMTTDTWCSDGTALFTSSGGTTTFNLTETLITQYVDSCIYVGQNSAATSIGVTAANTNEGRSYTPLATVSEAINRIKNANVARDYRIFVSGTVVDNVNIGDNAPNNLPTTAASSITIEGLNNNSDSNYTDIIRGAANSNQATIKIYAQIPVTFKNIKITTGISCTSTAGGGIMTSSEYNSTVTLAKGALIADCTIINTNSPRGAGVYLTAGTLIIKKGAKISNNKALTNGIGCQGGGIYCHIGTVRMEGGTIEGNNASYGAGVYIYKGTVFVYGNSQIINNNYETDNNTDSQTGDIINGGAFYLSGNNSVSHGKLYIGYKSATEKALMTGRIYNNTAQSYGGAIYSNEFGEVFIASGIIENNSISGTNDNSKSGGAIYGNVYLSGSVYIPYGGALYNNDIRGSIYIDDVLNPPQACLNNTDYPGIIAVASPIPADLIRGSVVVQKSGSVLSTITQYKDNFAVSYEDWFLSLNLSGTTLLLNSPIYVAGATHYVCEAAGTSGGNGTKASPFDSIENAVNSIGTTPDLDYLIYVDGELTAGQTVPNTKTISNAHSLTIKGANSFTSDANRKDIINASGEGTALSIQSMSVGTVLPVTIENLKITGGAQGSGGAGINVSTDRVLILGDDVLVQGNNGAGVLVYDSATLKVKGNVVITGNTRYGSTTPYNISLPNSKTIEVIGALKKGTSNANIGVTLGNNPTVGTPTAITTGYVTNGNSGVAPYTYFSGDSTAVVSTTSGEAALAFSGGNISVSPLFETITIGIDKTIGSCGAQSAFTFNTTDASGTVIPAGTGTGKINYSSYVVTYHGEDLTASTHYTTGTNSVILGTSLPVGNYTIYVTGDYNGQSYSAEFSVQLIQSGTISTLTASPTSGTYTLKTTEDFAKLIQWSNESSMNAGVTYTIEEDIVLTNWNVSSNATFKGTLDGNGHTITIGSLSSGTIYLLGKETSSATIKNLTVEGNVNGRYQGFANRFQSSSVMENVVSKVNVNYTGSGACSGLFYDCGNNCTIINCRNEGSIYAPNANKVGGIYSSDSASGVKIIGCVNTGNITGNTNVGGICGVTWSCVRDCRNEGTITGKNIVGGIAGMNYVPDSYTQGVINCINTGSVITSQTDGAVGGICGVLGCSNNASSTYNNGVLLNSVNLGTVQTDSVTSDYKGGLVGRIVEGCKVDYYQNNYYIQNGSLTGAGNSSDTSGVCNKFTNSGSSCNVASSITVGDYTGTDIVQLLNAWVNSNTLNFPVLSTYPLKNWKYGSGGNIEFDE